jgi:hypothetical protein
MEEQKGENQRYYKEIKINKDILIRYNLIKGKI